MTPYGFQSRKFTPHPLPFTLWFVPVAFGIEACRCFCHRLPLAQAVCDRITGQVSFTLRIEEWRKEVMPSGRFVVVLWERATCVRVHDSVRPSRVQAGEQGGVVVGLIGRSQAGQSPWLLMPLDGQGVRCTTVLVGNRAQPAHHRLFAEPGHKVMHEQSWIAQAPPLLSASGAPSCRAEADVLQGECRSGK